MQEEVAAVVLQMRNGEDIPQELVDAYDRAHNAMCNVNGGPIRLDALALLVALFPTKKPAVDPAPVKPNSLPGDWGLVLPGTAVEVNWFGHKEGTFLRVGHKPDTVRVCLPNGQERDLRADKVKLKNMAAAHAADREEALNSGRVATVTKPN